MYLEDVRRINPHLHQLLQENLILFRCQLVQDAEWGKSTLNHLPNKAGIMDNEGEIGIGRKQAE